MTRAYPEIISTQGVFHYYPCHYYPCDFAGARFCWRRPSVQGLAQGQLPAKGLKAKLFGTSPHLRPVPMATKETGQRVDVTRL